MEETAIGIGIVGVFDSQELAETFAKDYTEKFRKADNFESCRVIECEMNKPALDKIRVVNSYS